CHIAGLTEIDKLLVLVTCGVCRDVRELVQSDRNGPGTSWSTQAVRSCIRLFPGTSAAGNFSRLDAGSARVQALAPPGRHLSVHDLDVRVPPAVGTPVRMRDLLAETRSLATDVAHGSHCEHSFRVIGELGYRESHGDACPTAAGRPAKDNRSALPACIRGDTLVQCETSRRRSPAAGSRSAPRNTPERGRPRGS